MNYRDITAHEINNLFQLFMGYFPSTKSILSSKEDMGFVKAQWLRGLMVAGIVNADTYELNVSLFVKGISSLPFFNSQFMPSLGQFVHLCYEGIDTFNANSRRVQEDSV